MAYRQDLFAFTLSQLRGGKTQDELSQELKQMAKGQLVHGVPQP